MDDEELSDFGRDSDNVLRNAIKVEKPAKRARCHSATDLTVGQILVRV